MLNIRGKGLKILGLKIAKTPGTKDSKYTSSHKVSSNKIVQL